MIDVELFTAVFLAFMVGSGIQVFPSVKSTVAFTEEECWQAIKENSGLIEQAIEAKKGFKVFVIGICIPEERKA